MDRHIEVSQEYNTLRQELLEAKRYVFERPLAITAIAAIGLQSFEKPQHIHVWPVNFRMVCYPLRMLLSALHDSKRSQG